MAGVNDNLIPPKKGEVRNPKGRPKGIPNRKDILNYLLFESDVNEMGIITNKPTWWEKVKPKTLYQVITLAQAIKASGGDTQAYSALNKALGDTLDLSGSIEVRGATIDFAEHPTEADNTGSNVS